MFKQIEMKTMEAQRYKTAAEVAKVSLCGMIISVKFLWKLNISCHRVFDLINSRLAQVVVGWIYSWLAAEWAVYLLETEVNPE